MHIDFETYSEAGYDLPFGTTKGLSAVGAAVYAQHPSTRVLSLAYAGADGAGKLWLPDRQAPSALLEHLQRGGLLQAWNAAFEWWIWNSVCVDRHGFPPLEIEQLRCSMARARAYSLPGKLQLAGDVMGVANGKDKTGGALVKKMSLPQKKPSDITLLDRIDFAVYNLRDIRAEAEVAARCPELTSDELDVWLLDQRVNRRGVHVDRDALQACVALVEETRKHYDQELHELTEGSVKSVGQLARLKAWLAARGVVIDTMDADAIAAKLETFGPDWVLERRALEIRQAAGSAAVKKVFTIANQLTSSDRLHDLFIYHGARTGRSTGSGPQPMNLPKAGPRVLKCSCRRYSGSLSETCIWCGESFGDTLSEGWLPEAVDDVITAVRVLDFKALEKSFGSAQLCVSGVLRGLFCAAPGHTLIGSDYSSIEGVVLACLAGEDWRVQLFRTHGKIYELSASKIAGVPFADIMDHAGYEDVESSGWWKWRAGGQKPHHPLRQTVGKVAELASGFGGGLHAWKAFGASEFMTDDEISIAVRAWRAASPEIVHFWQALEGAVMTAILTPEMRVPVYRSDGSLTGICYEVSRGILACELPSKRRMYYHNARLEPSTKGWGPPHKIVFDGYNTNPAQGRVGWHSLDTYGGKLCENVVQAVARDVQAYAMLNLERAGYPIVLHVYDECVAEVPANFGSVDEFEEWMNLLPAWAMYRGERWPVNAGGGWRGKRYRKN